MHLSSPINADPDDPTTLSERFVYHTNTTSYNIAWTTLGNPKGAPVIFLHGTPWSSRLWARTATALAATGKYSVFLFDNPGYGASTAVPAGSSSSSASDIPPSNEIPDVTPRAAAEVFAALLKHWNFTSLPHIVAHDVGGQITLRGLLLHGLRYASMCLVDVVALSPLGSPFFKQVQGNPDLFDQMPPMVFEGAMRGYVNTATAGGKGGLDKPNEDALVAPWLESMGGLQGQRGWIRQAVQTSARLVEEVEGEYYGKIRGTLRVKIIWGKDDVWIPVDRAWKLGKELGAQEVVTVDNAGHLIQIDAPERLALEIASWLASVVKS